MHLNVDNTWDSKSENSKEIEICNECGRSVEVGSGLFVNRIPDFNAHDQRMEMLKPFPEGDFICIECDEKRNQEE